MQEYLAEIISLKHLTLDVVEITVHLIAPDMIDFKAGQTVQLKVQNHFFEVPIATPPSGDNHLITLCLQNPKHGALHDFLVSTTVGAQVKLQGPVGEFGVLDEQNDILCIAQATGVAPFASIIPDLLINKSFRKKLKLVFEVRSEENVFYYEKFTVLAGKFANFSFLPMVVRPHAHWPGEVGTAPTFVEVFGKNFADYDVYIAGVKEFVDAVTQQWQHSVANNKTIHAYLVPENS